MAQINTVDGLAQLSFLIQGALERRAAEHDVSLIQTRLLGVLRDRRPTMQELAKLLGLDKSSVTGLIDRAERRGLVTRVPSPTDRRSSLVDLTDRARELIVAVSAGFEADVTAMVGRLPEQDRTDLTDLIGRLLTAHAAAHGVDLFDTTG
ncbi:MarR family winged helix-turn-helix transcriptional regulator [Paractinoplanes durhamensis]|uniref:MarR family transcriptional regulator n=1 Tax=Paractinoplanes durhamensis TaxID=113563 RepID=A0ABQ3ZA55_9ACTN|nr:MarR family transcriptional regulator [Actinoplanes durhamensis]GIE06681.1 MarR family transcriptional regulator [Actinoplanes durhamensis]